jgi:hypothetical protein
MIAAELRMYRVERVQFHGVGLQEDKVHPMPGDNQCDPYNARWPLSSQRFSSRQHRSPTPKVAVEVAGAEQAVAPRVRAAQAARQQAQARVRRETQEAPPPA